MASYYRIEIPCELTFTSKPDTNNAKKIVFNNTELIVIYPQRRNITVKINHHEACDDYALLHIFGIMPYRSRFDSTSSENKDIRQIAITSTIYIKSKDIHDKTTTLKIIMVGSCNNNGKPVIQDIVQHDNTIMMLTERCEQYRNIINILTSTNPIRDKVLNIHHTSLSQSLDTQRLYRFEDCNVPINLPNYNKYLETKDSGISILADVSSIQANIETNVSSNSKETRQCVDFPMPQPKRRKSNK